MTTDLPDDDLAEIIRRSRIKEVVGEYIELLPVGDDSLKGLCPFHYEQNPSFNVRPSHGTFHCFGCGDGGTVIDFIMKIERVGFAAAVGLLAAKIGIR